MPRFLCYCPDYPNSLDKRLSVRKEHLDRAQLDREAGLIELGYPFLPKPETSDFSRELPEGTPRIGGSFTIYVLDSLEACWDRLKEDVYHRAGVWDKENMRVEQFL